MMINICDSRSHAIDSGLRDSIAFSPDLWIPDISVVIHELAVIIEGRRKIMIL